MLETLSEWHREGKNDKRLQLRVEVQRLAEGVMLVGHGEEDRLGDERAKSRTFFWQDGPRTRARARLSGARRRRLARVDAWRRAGYSW